MESNLKKIKNFGQKVWLDNLSRELLNSTELTNLINIDGIAGITSNPTIFLNSILNDSYYKKDLEKIKKTTLSVEERYEELVIPDIQKACDIFLPTYSISNKEEGYVSFEVSPLIAHDTKATIDAGLRIKNKINRPNLLIKIPATKNGIEAFYQLTALGINVNITLIFSIRQLLDVFEAYIKGVEERVKDNLNTENIYSVASFFISRIDSSLDSKLPHELQGKAAVKIAKYAYMRYLNLFEKEDKTNTLRKYNIKPQYLLWASTGTKNTAYSDVLYVEELIANKTINTIPEITLKAFKDHGRAREIIIKDIENSYVEINKYYDLDKLGDQLQEDGLNSFISSYNKLLQIVK